MPPSAHGTWVELTRCWMTAVLATAFISGCHAEAIEPAQPIPFSHKQHVTDNQIGCPMCHVYAEHSPVAGVPSMARCNGCHKFVNSDKPVIQSINQAFEDKRPIEWVRVYRLPDHVFFTHERHIAVGLACQTCHGEVQQMAVLRRARRLEMGWCVDCHRSRQAPTDCLTCHK